VYVRRGAVASLLATPYDGRTACCNMVIKPAGSKWARGKKWYQLTD
jgi:hypothetical protein